MSTDKYTVQLDSDIWDGLKQIAENLATLAYRVACDEDNEVSHYRSSVYMATHSMLKQAIRAAYPHRDTERIYDIWIECTESIAYCANLVGSGDYHNWGTCMNPGCQNKTDIDPEDGQYNSICSTCFWLAQNPTTHVKQHVHMRTTLDGHNYATSCQMVPTWDNGTHTGFACTGMDVQGSCGYWAPIQQNGQKG